MTSPLMRSAGVLVAIAASVLVAPLVSRTTSAQPACFVSTVSGDIQGAVEPASANNLVGDGSGLTGIVDGSRGNQVGYSGSWDNSYEIAEFEGKPGETYTIKIRRWSGSDDVWYGIAWTVTGGLLWADVTRGTVLQEAIARR